MLHKRSHLKKSIRVIKIGVTNYIHNSSIFVFIRRLRVIRKEKFTLIELLVVIAILGILASLLLPSLSESRQKAYTAVCLSNNRQIHVAMTNYQEPNDGAFPVASYNSISIPGFQNRAMSWDDLLSNYDGRDLTLDDKKIRGLDSSYDSSVYLCPAAKYTDEAYANRTYSMNAGWMGTTANVNLYGWGIAKYDSSKKLSEIEDPMTFILVENDKLLNYMGAGGNAHTFGDGFRNSSDTVNLYIHGNKTPRTNSVMVNGSARTFSILSEGVSPENFWTSNFD